MKSIDNYVACLEDFEEVRLVVNLLYSQNELNAVEYGYGVNVIHDLIERIYQNAKKDFDYDDICTNLPSYSNLITYNNPTLQNT